MSVKLNNLSRSIAYICPFCMQINTKNINIFEFSSHTPLKFLCEYDDCGEKCLYISRTKDKFKIDVECPVCEDVHSFIISSSGFLFKDLLTFKCPESNIDIFFIGDNEKVEKAVSEQS